MNTTAVIYARVSSIGDRQNTDRQVSDLLDYVKYQNLEIAKIYEEHISGAKKNNELDAEGKPTMFAPIMIATLSTCAQLERENIKFRLNSGRKLYIERGGKLGRKVGSVKTTDQKREEHKDIISYLKRGYSVRNTAKLTSKGISTVQRIKTEFAL